MRFSTRLRRPPQSCLRAAPPSRSLCHLRSGIQGNSGCKAQFVSLGRISYRLQSSMVVHAIEQRQWRSRTGTIRYPPLPRHPVTYRCTRRQG